MYIVIHVFVHFSSFTKIKNELKSHNQMYTYDCIIAEVQTAHCTVYTNCSLLKEMEKKRETDRMMAYFQFSFTLLNQQHLTIIVETERAKSFHSENGKYLFGIQSYETSSKTNDPIEFELNER